MTMQPPSRKQAKQQARDAQQAAAEYEQLEKVGLNVDQYPAEELRRRNAISIATANRRLIGSGLYSFGSLLQGKGDSAFILEATKAQIEQNWVIIRQNEQIIRLLEQQTRQQQQQPPRP